ncbi:MAG: hypothetical protein ACSHXZ_15085, partial [Gammaproteobacteria bacterium]
FNHLPDYVARFVGEEHIEFCSKKAALPKPNVSPSEQFFLASETYLMAKDEAPTWDVYYLEDRWRAWMNEKAIKRPVNVDNAFLSFCRTWYGKRGQAE